MKALLYTLLAVISTLLSGCTSVYTVSPMHSFGWDPRCQPRQYCPYTDPPPAIRTEQLRS